MLWNFFYFSIREICTLSVNTRLKILLEDKIRPKIK